MVKLLKYLHQVLISKRNGMNIESTKLDVLNSLTRRNR